MTRLTGSRHAPVEFGPRWTSSVLPARMLDCHLAPRRATCSRRTPDAPPVAVRALESMLVDAILLGTPHSHSALLAAPRADAPGHAARVRGWLEEHYAEPVAVGDVAAGVGLSVRQVQQVVRDAYGPTPMRLLRDVRLDRARALLWSGIVPTVSAAATSAGFTHLGRFAAAYRARFGELPSTTR